MKYWYIIPVVIVAVLIGTIWFIGNDPSFTGKAVSGDDVLIDLGPDIVNLKEGTIVIWYSENLTDRKDGVAQFFKSRKIPGLFIKYRFEDNTLVAGLPEMTGKKSVYFDGRRHFMAYMYKLNASQQLYFDQELLADAPYTGIKERSLLGMVIGYPAEELSPEEAEYYPEVLSPEQIRTLT